MFFNGASNNVYNIFVENNTFVGTKPWSFNQRTNGNQQFGLHLPRAGNPTISNLVFKNNVFFNFDGCGIVMDTFTQWQGLMTMDYNDWIGSRGPSLTSICTPSISKTISSWSSHISG